MLTDEVLAAPPRVHTSTGAPHGVWRSDESLYRLIEDEAPGRRSLEVGCGISTILFAQLSREHTCAVISVDEAEVIRRYCGKRRISLDQTRFAIGPSYATLPLLEPTPLDVCLLDGCHGFPTPALDWFYAARRLVTGGLVIVDDIDLAAVQFSLGRYLERDPRWEVTAQAPTWVAYVRLSEGDLLEEWTEQSFL